MKHWCLLFFIAFISCEGGADSLLRNSEIVNYKVYAQQFEAKPYSYNKECSCWNYGPLLSANDSLIYTKTYQHNENVNYRRYGIELRSNNDTQNYRVVIEVDENNILDTTFSGSLSDSLGFGWFWVGKEFN